VSGGGIGTLNRPLTPLAWVVRIVFEEPMIRIEIARAVAALKTLDNFPILVHSEATGARQPSIRGSQTSSLRLLIAVAHVY